MGKEINYPNQSKKIFAITTPTMPKRNYQKANLGANFENQINDSCAYYLQKGIASIYKKPTPIQIVKVDYPSRKKARIVEAYYKTPSTTDYNGIYKGYYSTSPAKSKSRGLPFGTSPGFILFIIMFLYPYFQTDLRRFRVPVFRQIRYLTNLLIRPCRERLGICSSSHFHTKPQL